ncbi:MAG: CocE/NonD family hydrolase, partial [Acidobacteriaceae bacterium]|nr:CocE/NonD family hydrolase [Acidobacteriaceae bacterium]
MFRKIILLTGLTSLATATAAQAASADAVVEHGVAVKMRDGVTLRADIYRPKQEGTFPVLLQRTPYDKRGGVSFGYKAAEHGYVVIIQDVRGRYSSQGEW